jgi:hypothetical protein
MHAWKHRAYKLGLNRFALGSAEVGELPAEHKIASRKNLVFALDLSCLLGAFRLHFGAFYVPFYGTAMTCIFKGR